MFTVSFKVQSQNKVARTHRIEPLDPFLSAMLDSDAFALSRK